MPLIRVELFDYRMSEETSAALIEKLTDALGEATHPGLKEHTWVIVVSDHGEELWEHGGFLHGHSLYDELLRVPLDRSPVRGALAGLTLELQAPLLFRSMWLEPRAEPHPTSDQ